MSRRILLSLLVIALLALPLLLVGCGSSSGPSGDVVVSPSTAALLAGGTQTFTATVSGVSSTAVNWTVTEGAAGGSITSAGVYTAPATAGTYHIVATNQADSAKTSTATVTVTVPPTTGDANGTIQ